METNQPKPDWWIENEEDRDAMDLPEYEPPRFEDQEYVHTVVPKLEEKHSCEITFMGINVDWGDEWDVRVDGETEFTVERSRDDSGNTIYHIDSSAFAQKIEESVLD